jgi:flagellin
MTISITGSAAAQTALDPLGLQQLNPADAGAAALLNATAPQDPALEPAAPVVDISGLPASLNGETHALVDSAAAVDAAVSAGTTIEGLLARLRQDALSAADSRLGSDARAALDTGFQTDLAGVQSAIAQAGAGGVNLLDGSASDGGQAGADSLTGVDLTLGGPLIGVAPGASLTDPGQAASLADQLGSAIDNVRRAIGGIAQQGEAIQSHLAVLQQAGLAASVDASSLDSDGARLQALQIQQQLTLSGAAIANQAPQSILALFR